jgi:hypothetical protein
MPRCSPAAGARLDARVADHRAAPWSKSRAMNGDSRIEIARTQLPSTPDL